MLPIRLPLWRHPAGTCFVLFLFFIVVLCAGCFSHKATSDAPSSALYEPDSLQAGALALYAHGMVLEEGGDGSDTNAAKEAALDAFRHAANLDPSNPKFVAAITQNLVNRERYDDALETLEKFLQRDDAALELRLAAARVAEAADRPADAARHCRILLDTHPEDRELAQALIRLYFLSEQSDRALALMREQNERFNDKASALLPAQWAAYFSRDPKLQDIALKCIDTARDLQDEPQIRGVLESLAAECWLNLGQTNMAVVCLLEAYRSNEAEHSPLLRLGALWATMPDAVKAIEDKAALPSATHVDMLLLASTRQALEDKDAAIKILEDVYAMRMRQGYFPEAGFYIWLAALLESKKVLPETERWLTEALSVHPYSHELQNFLAYMWAEQGINLDKANKLVNAALIAQPNNAAYQDTKGWILYKAGRYYDALQYLLKAAENDNEEPVILDHTGDALLAVGRKNEAISFWTESHKLSPEPTVAEKLRQHGAPVPESTP
jgi:tetratricopeptide (TPR) repeat protein